MRTVTRRDLIRAGIGALGVLLLARNPLRLIASRRDDEWEMPREGRVHFVSGSVSVNGRRAEEGMTVSAGDVLVTGPGSEVEVEIRDISIFHVKENSRVEVSDILGRPKLKVTRGWFLIIIRRGTDFSVETPTVLAGVRGTVFFFRVYDDQRSYLCDCNGLIDLYDTAGGGLVRSVRSQYHAAFDVTRRADGQVSVERAGLRYHEDDDILRMAGRFSRETRVFQMRQREGRSSY